MEILDSKLPIFFTFAEPKAHGAGVYFHTRLESTKRIKLLWFIIRPIHDALELPVKKYCLIIFNSVFQECILILAQWTEK